MAVAVALWAMSLTAHTTEAAVPPIPREWLRSLGRGQSAMLRRSGLILSAEALAAVGFAAGLALGVAHLADGLAASAPWLVLAAVSATARGLIAMVAARIAATAALEIKSTARRAAAGAMFARSPSDRRTSGEAMAAVVEGVEALDGYFSRFVPARSASAIVPVVILAAVAVASPICAVILLLTLIPFVVGMWLAGTAAAEDSRRQFQALERLSGLFLDKVRALPLILAFQAEDAQTQALAKSADELQRRTARVLRTAFLSSGVLEFFAALSVALVAVYCGFNLLRLLPFPVPEILTLPRAFFALALAPEVYAPMRRLAAAYHDRQAAEAAAPTFVAPKPRAVPPVALQGGRAPAIRFTDVSIQYADEDEPVFNSFDLDLPSGSITALVGPSGAGKSSLLNLLLGLAPLSGGEVWVDGRRLSDLGSFAPMIAFVGQTPLIIPGSLADNIALARRDASPAEIDAVAERVGLGDALRSRLGGVSAHLDERGGGLSGGERRRLGLARAILKPSSILLLDEPTANLDDLAARSLLPVIAAAARGRTTLIATHSEAVAGLANRVVRL
jgi:ATP-binding cassette, subfamily C, bacterial CydD